MRGDFLRPPHGTTLASVIINKNKKFRSFKSKEIIIRMAEDWPYLGFDYKTSSVTLLKAAHFNALCIPVVVDRRQVLSHYTCYTSSTFFINDGA